MEKSKAVLFKIKDGQEENWKEWCKKVQTDLYNEAKISLEEEGVVLESSLLFELQSKKYIVGFMVGDSKPANMERQINKIHKAKREECLEYVSGTDILYLIQNQQS